MPLYPNHPSFDREVIYQWSRPASSYSCCTLFQAAAPNSNSKQYSLAYY